MTIKDKIRHKLRDFLWLEPADGHSVHVRELYDFEANAFRNRMWVRGDPYELGQFFKNSRADNASFWSAVPHTKIHKLHSGIPSMMVNVMSAIVCRDFDGFELSSRDMDWEAIAKDNKFPGLLRRAIKDTITVGDGAWKLSNDPELSDYPIIEYFSGEQVDFIYKRGRLREVIFRTIYNASNSKSYVLYEHYGWGYIKYVLREMATGDPVPLDMLDETRELQDIALFDYDEDADGKPKVRSDVMLAVPMLLQDSSKWQGRGESLIDRKESAFDALDEILSQWADAVRSGRPTKYIPRALAPVNTKGEIVAPNDFDNAYILTKDDMRETGTAKIEVVQPEIKSESYLQAYITYLDLCLQGIMSPSTLGIDTKKLDNAEAQREKEKTTLYTRNLIIEALQKTLPLLVNAVICAYDAFTGKTKPATTIDVNVKFGEYASPSFEALIEVLSKAKTAGLMSVEALIDELYGDSKDDKWKAEEVQRIKDELGISESPEDEGLSEVSQLVEEPLTNTGGENGNDISDQGA